MLRSFDDVVRVSTRVATVVAIVGFLVLMLNGRAYPAEQGAVQNPTIDDSVDRTLDPRTEVERILLQRQTVTERERLNEAREVLGRDRRSRVAGMSLAVLDTSWRVAMGGSPRSMWKGARRLYKQGKRWVGHTAAERRALDLIEPAVASGSLDPEILELYTRLREEEEAGLAKHKLDSAERALSEGNLGRARRRLALVRELDPDAKRLHVLEELLAEKEELERIPRPEERLLVASRPTLDELRLNVALLVGRYERVREAEAQESDERLRRAVALHLSGEIELALAELEALAEGTGTVADIAQHWIDQPALNPELGMRRAGRQHRVDRTLTWLGGGELQQRGTEKSLDGVNAWRHSLAPTNLVVGLPTRMWRGDDASAEDKGTAARRYLQIHPRGPSAAQAVEWLAEAERSLWNDSGSVAWVDGRFVLPPARTAYSGVLGRPILLTRDLLLEAERPELAGRLAEDEALLLAAFPPGMPPRGEPLEREAAIDLVRDVARRLDTGEARAFGRRHRAALEALRHLDTAIRSGRTRVRIAPWSRERETTRNAVESILADGEQRHLAWMQVSQGSDSYRASRELAGPGLLCPGRLVCVDRERSFSSGAYAELETDGNMHVGTRARYRGVAVDVGLHEFLPAASLSIPLGSWLRIADWVPAGATFAIGAGGVSISPVTDDVREQGASQPDEL
jgi:hypothetical protein